MMYQFLIKKKISIKKVLEISQTFFFYSFYFDLWWANNLASYENIVIIFCDINAIRFNPIAFVEL